MVERLQKYLASCGICSRRNAEELINKGLVTVNDKVAVLGMKIDDNYDIVKYKGKIVKQQKKIYIMLHKPNGCVTTSDDQFNRSTVIDLIKKDISERLFSVGRLDYNTEGLLFLTNDGDFSEHIIHPSSNIYKTYIANVKGGIISKEQLWELRKGVKLEDGITAPAKININEILPDGTTMITISICEGKNRQVRRMCEAVGHPVKYLKRISVGDVELGNLPYGKWRHLTQAEIDNLTKQGK